jgi:hypothetical protein
LLLDNLDAQLESWKKHPEKNSDTHKWETRLRKQIHTRVRHDEENAKETIAFAKKYEVIGSRFV